MAQASMYLTAGFLGSCKHPSPMGKQQHAAAVSCSNASSFSQVLLRPDLCIEQVRRSNIVAIMVILIFITSGGIAVACYSGVLLFLVSAHFTLRVAELFYRPV
jgi:hypothetical protein